MKLGEGEDRWGRKIDTDCNDLLSAIMCYLRANQEGRNNMCNLNRFLKSIEPPSGWVEDPNYNPQRATTRSDYGPDFCLLHTGGEKK